MKLPLVQIFFSFGVISVLGCSPTSSSTTNGALGGAVVGGTAGSIVGYQSGNAGTGAVVGATGGALVGGTAGYVNDQSKKKFEEDSVMELQKAQMEKQQKELEDLRRQQYYDDRLRGRFEK